MESHASQHLPKGKTRAWTFTLNNYTPQEYDTLLNNSLSSYVIIGKERSKEGTLHLQGYIRFPNAVRASTLTKLNGRMHIEQARDEAEFNIMYCTKGDGVFNKQNRTWHNHGLNADWEERGTRPSVAPHLEGMLYNIATLIELVSELQLPETFHDEFMIYLNDLQHDVEVMIDYGGNLYKALREVEAILPSSDDEEEWGNEECDEDMGSPPPLKRRKTEIVEDYFPFSQKNL